MKCLIAGSNIASGAVGTSVSERACKSIFPSSLLNI